MPKKKIRIMKYEAVFTIKRKIRVVIESDNNSISEIGEIKTTNDFNGEDDPRWEVEEQCYDAAFNYNNYIEHDGGEGGSDEVINRSIKIYEE